MADTAPSDAYMSIHPPDVVLVQSQTSGTASPTSAPMPGSSHQSSPIEQHPCSPLSTAPNSPCHITDDEDYDDDEEEDEEAYEQRRSNDIKNLLVAPPSNTKSLPSLLVVQYLCVFPTIHTSFDSCVHSFFSFSFNN